MGVGEASGRSLTLEHIYRLMIVGEVSYLRQSLRLSLAICCYPLGISKKLYTNNLVPTRLIYKEKELYPNKATYSMWQIGMTTIAHDARRVHSSPYTYKSDLEKYDRIERIKILEEYVCGKSYSKFRIKKILFAYAVFKRIFAPRLDKYSAISL